MDHRSCIKAPSPADRIREEQAGGHRVEGKDLSDSAVQVDSYDYDGDSYTRWVYYRTRGACEAALPGAQPISSDYE
ncbi:hypothetical protein D9M71_812310 [compost metagenome]